MVRDRRRWLTHGFALAAGILIGVAATLILAVRPQHGSNSRTAEPGSCAATVQPAADTIADPSPPSTDHTGDIVPSWVRRPASDAQILTSSGVMLPITAPVDADDALDVTMMLTDTCPGRVTVTDSKGDDFRLVGETTDVSRHRTLVLAAFHVKALSMSDTIQVGYPQSSKYHVAVDEFHGISGIGAHTQAHGNAGGTAFATGTLNCTSGALLIGAVGTNSGTAPAFASGWSELPALKLSSYRLTTAYQVVDISAPCGASGTTTAQWTAVLAAFR
jgi:hypothetical protein